MRFSCTASSSSKFTNNVQFYFDDATYIAIGRPAHVLVGFDIDTGRVTIQPSTKDNPDARCVQDNKGYKYLTITARFFGKSNPIKVKAVKVRSGLPKSGGVVLALPEDFIKSLKRPSKRKDAPNIILRKANPKTAKAPIPTVKPVVPSAPPTGAQWQALLQGLKAHGFDIAA